MANVLFIFASTSGNTEMVVDEVAALLEKKKHKVTKMRAEILDATAIKKADFIVLGSPTYGHGLLHDYLEVKLPEIAPHLGGKACAVIGLGDPTYDKQYHIEAAPILEKFIKENGGNLMLPALKISRTPVRFLDTLIPMWAKDLAKQL